MEKESLRLTVALLQLASEGSAEARSVQFPRPFSRKTLSTVSAPQSTGSLFCTVVRRTRLTWRLSAMVTLAGVWLLPLTVILFSVAPYMTKPTSGWLSDNAMACCSSSLRVSMPGRLLMRSV